MNVNEIVDKYLPFTQEDHDCRIKRANKERLRDALKHDILEYAAKQTAVIVDNINKLKQQHGIDKQITV